MPLLMLIRSILSCITQSTDILSPNWPLSSSLYFRTVPKLAECTSLMTPILFPFLLGSKIQFRWKIYTQTVQREIMESTIWAWNASVKNPGRSRPLLTSKVFSVQLRSLLEQLFSERPLLLGEGSYSHNFQVQSWQKKYRKSWQQAHY